MPLLPSTQLLPVRDPGCKTQSGQFRQKRNSLEVFSWLTASQGRWENQSCKVGTESLMLLGLHQVKPTQHSNKRELGCCRQRQGIRWHGHHAGMVAPPAALLCCFWELKVGITCAAPGITALLSLLSWLTSTWVKTLGICFSLNSNWERATQWGVPSLGRNEGCRI